MQTSRRPEYLGEPTLGRVMRRPQWILALLLALAVAAGFAALAQWQAGNAVRAQAEQEIETEEPRPLDSVTEPGQGVTDVAAGVVVDVSGTFVAGDFRTVAPRVNQGETGVWVVGNLATETAEGTDADPGHLAVAVGWAPNQRAADDAIEKLDAALTAGGDERAATERYEGRYMPPEAPDVPKPSEPAQTMHSMVPAAFANSWDHVDGMVYAGYLVLHGVLDDVTGTAVLDPIDSVAPLPPETVNWLNVFYAIEWIVFAGFAVFLWYRLARDAWEKEHEMKLLVATADGDSGTPGSDDPRPVE